MLKSAKDFIGDFYKSIKEDPFPVLVGGLTLIILMVFGVDPIVLIIFALLLFLMFSIVQVLSYRIKAHTEKLLKIQEEISEELLDIVDKLDKMEE